MAKRILALILVICMSFSLMAPASWAAELPAGGISTIAEDDGGATALPNSAGDDTTTPETPGNGGNQGTNTPTKKDIESCTITLSASTYTYDGTAKQPTVTVKDGNTTLTSTDDYTATYSNNINAGTATVTVTGKGSYIGSKTASFTIAKANQTVNLGVASSRIEVGGQTTATPEGSLTYYGARTFSSSNTSVATVDTTGKITAVGAGTATITVNFAGDSNHNAASASVTVTVSALSLSGFTITLAETEYTYDGEEKTPNVASVSNSDTTLKAGTDYRVSYQNNTHAGTASVVITGIGKYAGATATKTFTINQAEQSEMEASVSNNGIKIGSTAEITVQYSYGTLTYSSSDAKIATVDSQGVITGVSAGKATITVRAAGDTNYKAATDTVEVEVAEPDSIVSAEVELSETAFPYDGEEKEPEVLSVVMDGVELKEGTDYTVSYEDNKESGTAYVVITGKNGYKGEKRVEFTIGGKISKCKITLSKSAYTYDGQAKKPSITVKDGDVKLVKNQDYSISYKNNVNVGKATVTIKGKGAYSGTVKKYYTIEKGTNTIKASNYTKTSSAKVITFTIKPTVEKKTTLTYKSNNSSVKVGKTSGKVTIAKNYVGKATITITAAATSSCEKTTKKITVTVKPRTTTPTVTSPTFRKAKISWAKVSGITKYELQISTAKSFGGKGVSTAIFAYDPSTTTRTINSFTSGKTYYFRMRTYKTISGTKYYSGWSAVKSVKVK